MHELSLAESILQLIEDAAIEQKFTQVKTVWLEVGQLACVEQESLRFFFTVVTEDSIARQAKLEIIDIAGQAMCDQCHQVMMTTTYHQVCSQCGSYALHVTQGDGMRIKELEVE
ncbi:hydrogenase nickel incorporation protein HypA/HybF [Nitrosomonas oligotropha]|uniref:Hydrogenase maturation factor HypA n=1 Tax=Nitrosomonas oligotropha TaxID=42354 RepID=A0A2T5I3B9_9PROT|nr:hydrogenase maturation nickel metallochaperone HypA [Nitrosomonas oligotropha]PTQ78331.1 hydrogenase nickel incorporation protein HypA/HybF [Nitrosomonas oligotropha]